MPKLANGLNTDGTYLGEVKICLMFYVYVTVTVQENINPGIFVENCFSWAVACGDEELGKV